MGRLQHEISGCHPPQGTAEDAAVPRLWPRELDWVVGAGGCPWESIPSYQRQSWPGRPRAPGEGSIPKAVAGPQKRGWGSTLQPPFLGPHTQPDQTVHSVGTAAEKGDSRKILRDSPAILIAQYLREAPKAQKEAEWEQPARWTSRAGRRRQEGLDVVGETPEKSLPFTCPPGHRQSHPFAWENRAAHLRITALSGPAWEHLITVVWNNIPVPPSTHVCRHNHVAKYTNTYIHTLRHG